MNGDDIALDDEIFTDEDVKILKTFVRKQKEKIAAGKITVEGVMGAPQNIPAPIEKPIEKQVLAPKQDFIPREIPADLMPDPLPVLSQREENWELSRMPKSVAARDQPPRKVASPGPAQQPRPPVKPKYVPPSPVSPTSTKLSLKPTMRDATFFAMGLTIGVVLLLLRVFVFKGA